RAHVVHGRRQPFGTPRAQHQRRARFGEPFRHLTPEPARAARDDRDTAIEVEQFVEGWHDVTLYTSDALEPSTNMTQTQAPAAGGELVGAYALPAPQPGSDALAARTTATLTPDGRHYLLNGQKMWITNGGFADLFTIFAKVDGDKFTAFLVERGMGVASGRDE